MGMFDTILVPRSIFTNLSDKETEIVDRKYGKGEIECQTKDFSCGLDIAVMDSEGNLTWKVNNGYYGEQPDLTKWTGILNLYDLIAEQPRSTLQPFGKDIWIEYEAKYIDGKMVSIKRV
jgi:hypothetical protein